MELTEAKLNTWASIPGRNCTDDDLQAFKMQLYRLGFDESEAERIIARARELRAEA